MDRRAGFEYSSGKVLRKLVANLPDLSRFGNSPALGLRTDRSVDLRDLNPVLVDARAGQVLGRLEYSA